MTATIKLINNDIDDDEATGRMNVVVDTEKLRQDVARCMSMPLTLDGTGAGLTQAVGLVSSAADLRQVLAGALSSSLQALKARQSSVQAGQRTAKERIASLSSVAVAPLKLAGASPRTTYAYKVTVTSADAQATATSTGLIS